MSSIADRLRDLVRGGGFKEQDAPHESHELRGPDPVDPTGASEQDRLQRLRRSGPVGPAALDPARAADVLDGQWHQVGHHRFLVVERSYPPGHRHGAISVADSLPPDGGWPRLALLGGAPCDGRPLFIDLETTGLAGGAGTYAFLVGCGWFDSGRFRVRQFFLSSFASERALLEAVGELAQSAGTIVTYNGKTFDLPLIETRYALNRLATPFAGMPHVDLLHPARRLWRGRDDGHHGDRDASSHTVAEPSCRLSRLEYLLLGHERVHDVPGFEIPARYFRYVHSGDPRPLDAVLEHNRLDLLSLAFLTARAAQLLDGGAEGTETAREALGLGRLYDRAGLVEEAFQCFRRAAEIGPELRADALRARALLARRTRRHADAAHAWQQLLDLADCPPQLEREAAEALAVHHEHRLRNLSFARTLALRSLALEARVSRRHAAEHRLVRLDRKLSLSQGAPALF